MTPLTAFVIIALIFAIGDIVSTVSKARIPSIFIAALLFLLGYWTFFPKNIIDLPGLGAPMTMVALSLLMVHMGTMVSIKEMAAQWRTVVIVIIGLIGMTLLVMLIGSPLIGRETAVAGAPTLAGGVVAAILMSEAAKAQGLTAISVLVLVLCVMQDFFGYPLTALCLRKESQRLLSLYRQGKEESVAQNEGETNNRDTISWRVFPLTPEKYRTPFVLLAKMGLVALLGVAVSNWTQGKISPHIICLLMGVVAAETGFLERKPLNLSCSFGWLMLALLAFIYTGLVDATPAMLLKIVGPLLVVVALGIIGMFATAFLVGPRFGFNYNMAFAVILTCLYGFPGTYILTEEAAKAVAQTPDEKEFLMTKILPKMLVGGFTSVTVFSVVMAGVMAKWI